MTKPRLRALLKQIWREADILEYLAERNHRAREAMEAKTIKGLINTAITEIDEVPHPIR